MHIQTFLSATAIVVLSLQGSSVIAQSAGGSGNFVTSCTPWPRIMEVDITARTRFWRQMDVKDNRSLFTADDNAQQLIDILMQGIRDGKQAYDAADDRFTTTRSYDEVMGGLKGLILSQSATDPATGKVLSNCLKSDDLAGAMVRLIIKEDVLKVKGMDKEQVRIVGIAPVVLVADEKGVITEKKLCWIYYPDAREYLSRFQAPGSGQSWEAVFEGRHFESTVIRSAVHK